MQSIVEAFSNTLGQYVSAEVCVFIISMLPIVELRGGLLAASLLKVPITTAVPICILGNIIPIPFLLLFIKEIFKQLKKVKLFRGLVERLEARALAKSADVSKYEMFGLTLVVGIPLPGTGAWTGSLIASLLEMDFKKALIAELLGIMIATVIVSILSYGLLGAILN